MEDVKKVYIAYRYREREESAYMCYTPANAAARSAVVRAFDLDVWDDPEVRQSVVCLFRIWKDWAYSCPSWEWSDEAWTRSSWKWGSGEWRVNSGLVEQAKATEKEMVLKVFGGLMGFSRPPLPEGFHRYDTLVQPALTYKDFLRHFGECTNDNISFEYLDSHPHAPIDPDDPFLDLYKSRRPDLDMGVLPDHHEIFNGSDFFVEEFEPLGPGPSSFLYASGEDAPDEEAEAEKRRKRNQRKRNRKKRRAQEEKAANAPEELRCVVCLDSEPVYCFVPWCEFFL
jgi:hypothetical protein